MTAPERYDGWHTVPEHLRTKTQLADLDLPRIPGGEPVGYVYDRGPHGRKGTFELYDLAASVPSLATGVQLDIARARQGRDVRRCEKCGARPEQRPTPHRSSEGEEVMLLCHACLHIARLRAAQHRAASDRAAACRDAAYWLAADTAALIHLAPITPPPAPDGRAKRPLALVVGAFTPSGRVLYRTTVRLNRSRNPIVPTDATPADEAFPALRNAVAGRDLIEWASGSLKHLDGALTAPAEPARTWREITALDTRVTAWRGQIDPRTHRRIPARDPGRADLMALLIRRMAADHNPGNGAAE